MTERPLLAHLYNGRVTATIFKKTDGCSKQKKEVVQRRLYKNLIANHSRDYIKKKKTIFSMVCCINE